MNTFALLGRHTSADYELLADASEQLRIAQLVADELSRPDRTIDAPVLELALAELRQAQRVYLDRRAAVDL